MNITKNSKNQELEAAFAEQVSSGNVFIFAIEPTKNEDYVSIYIAQRKNNGTVNDMDKLFLGWGNTIVRAIRNSKKEIANQMGLKVGNYINNAAIQITESFTATTEGDYTTKAVINPTTNEEVLVDGKPIYRTTELVSKAECNDTIIDRTSVQQPAALSTKANAEKTFA